MRLNAIKPGNKATPTVHAHVGGTGVTALAECANLEVKRHCPIYDLGNQESIGKTKP